MANSFGAKARLRVGNAAFEIFRLEALAGEYEVATLPYSLRVLLENTLRHEGRSAGAADVEAIAAWDASAGPSNEIAFTPTRVLLQDFTGVPAIVDLAAMRDAMRALEGEPSAINPQLPIELVIDH